MYWRCFLGVLKREMLKFWQQRSRLLSGTGKAFVVVIRICCRLSLSAWLVDD